MTYVGIDGIPGGWVAVYLEPSRQRFNYSGSLERLLSVPFDRAMIDVPIGLPAIGYRECDVAARRLHGPSVFLGARWGVWDFASSKAANEHYHAAGQPGISVQLWGIRDKLQEANTWITPLRQETVKECHPEVVFHRLNGGAPLKHSKKTAEGRAARIELLEGAGVTRIREWLGQRDRTGIGRDDLIDACAAAIAARDPAGCLPETPGLSAQGIRMEIWF
jgi:predicted RNase H-like nuclease